MKNSFLGSLEKLKRTMEELTSAKINLVLFNLKIFFFQNFFGLSSGEQLTEDLVLFC